MHRAGAFYCAACGASLSTPVANTAPVEVSSVRLPVDAKRDAFNRACRSGRVRGARKQGRVWICTLEAWNARADAPAPAGLPKRKRSARVMPLRPKDDHDVCAELGLAARRSA